MTSATRAKKPASYADLEALPENVVGELIDGELIVSPRPRLRHAGVESALDVDLGGPFQFGRGGGPGGWIFMVEPELHLGKEVLVPDLAGWRKERMPAIPDEPYATLPPDWVCEILSPSTASLDRVRKVRIYAREKIPHGWFIDPDLRTLEVYKLTGVHWMILSTHEQDEIVRAEPFDAVPLDLLDLWGEARQPELGGPSPEHPLKG